MISFLSRIFIKDYKNYSDMSVRLKYGMLCSFLGIFLNVFLCVAKFAAGFMSKSVALTADAFNNLSDAASSIVTMLGFKLASRKSDRKHPFGHGRMEYVSGFIVSFFILLMAFELFRDSVSSVIHPAKTEFSLLSVFIMLFAVAVKLYMYAYNHSIAKKISSETMEAVAKDSFSDMFSTFVALASLFASRYTSVPVDGIAGCAVAFFILKTGVESFRETLDPLLGIPPEKEFVKNIETEVRSHDLILGMHDLIVHDYGPGRKMISLHAEVSGNDNIFACHEAIDRLELDLAEKFGCFATIHMDPIDVSNPRLMVLKKSLASIVCEIDSGITVHDVRLVPGEMHTNLIFDIVRPYECRFSHERVSEIVAERMHSLYDDVVCVITVDDPYVS